MQHLTRFGLLAAVLCLACLLVVLFSSAMAAAIAPLGAWKERTADSGAPPGRISPVGAARGLVVVLMLASYGCLDISNALLFLALAVGCLLSFICLWRRHRALRRAHACQVIDPADASGARRLWLPIGSESELYEQARAELQDRRRRQQGLSLAEFLQDHGASPPRPAALWPPGVLARSAERLHTAMVMLILCGAGAVFLTVLLLALPQG